MLDALIIAFMESSIDKVYKAVLDSQQHREADILLDVIAIITDAIGFLYATYTVTTTDVTTFIETRAAAACMIVYIDDAIIVMRLGHFYSMDDHYQRLLDYSNWTLSHVWDCISVKAHISTQSEIIHGMFNASTT